MTLKPHIHYSIELETEVLGACLLETTAFSRVFSILEPKVFYKSSHGIIYSAMQEMFSLNYPISILSIVDYLTRKKRIENFEGDNVPYYIVKLTKPVVTTANLEYYSLILKQMWIDREIITLTHAGTKDEDSRKAISNLQQKLTELSSISHVADWKEMDELVVDLIKHQDIMQETGGKGLLTGFHTIDTVYGGFFPNQMIVIGARPSVGKSAFAGQIAMNMAKLGQRVGFISLEMSNTEIAARFSAIDTNISFGEIFRNLYQDENQRDYFYKRVSASTSNLPISVSDKTDVNISEIRAKAFKLKHKHGNIGCLIVDYLQLVDGDNTQNRNRENEVAKISRGLKILAKDIEAPVIVLCQLNREVEKRTGKNRYPQLSDFRETGAIEQDADVAMFLHSDFKSGHVVNEDGSSTEDQADLVIRKWRNGQSNLIIPLDFDGPKMKFSERKKDRFIPVRNIENYNKDNPF